VLLEGDGFRVIGRVKSFRFQAQILITASVQPHPQPYYRCYDQRSSLLRRQWTQARFKATLDLDWSAFVMHDSDDSHRDGVVFEGALVFSNLRDRRHDSHLTLYCISKDLVPYTPILFLNNTAASSVEAIAGVIS
jgi:hypothetical protein